MYDKLNKTEKRIVRAWGADTIDKAYAGLYQTGWDKDFTVSNVSGKRIINLPKTHPDMAVLSERLSVTIFDKTLTDVLKVGHIEVVGDMPKVTVDTRCGYECPALAFPTVTMVFESPVRIITYDNFGNVMWCLGLVWGGMPYATAFGVSR